MHKLDRERIDEPQCLSDYDYRQHSWDDNDFGRMCKKQLRKALYLLQGKPNLTDDKLLQSVRCAYCENSVHSKAHIEHFRRKNHLHFPHLTFAWQNLFLSCKSQVHCGHYKDRKNALPYNPNDLIKPDESCPDDFLYFHSNGYVRVKSGLCEAKQRMADTTISVFNLNEGTLVRSRRRAIDRFLEPILDDLEEIEQWPDPEKTDFFTEQIAQTNWLPFATAIRHSLSSKA